MAMTANFVVALVAALHLYFLVLEMFLWTRPLGLKTFRNTPEKAADSAVLAANRLSRRGPGLGIDAAERRLRLSDQGIFPCLRRCGRRLRRGNRQPSDFAGPGGAGRAGVASAM